MDRQFRGCVFVLDDVKYFTESECNSLPQLTTTVVRVLFMAVMNPLALSPCQKVAPTVS